MKVTRLFSLLACLLLGVVGTSVADSGPQPERKIIYYGWNTRDSAYVAAHWGEMEQMPFDGIGIGIALDRAQPTNGDGSTANLLGWQTFGAEAFDAERFATAISELQTPQWTRFTDNFLPVAIATQDQDQGLSWFDDARWATIENNWRVLLTIARDGRCRGLLLDPEHYDYACELFNYSHHAAQRDARSFEEYTAIARHRGQHLGATAREIFPAITIALLYGYTLPAREVRHGHTLATARYALLPAFLDGLREGAAPDAQFVDLCEFAHRYLRAEQFSKARAETQADALALSASADSSIAAISPGMSTRIDFQLPGGRWHVNKPSRNYFSPARFREALRGALAATDRYVWIYSEESPGFFPPTNLPPKYITAIKAARQPLPKTASVHMPLLFGVLGALLVGLWIPMHRARRGSTERMRVLIVTGIFPPDHGGPASYVPRMAAALVRRGHQVETICLSDRVAQGDDAYPFPVRRIARRQFWPLRIARTVLAVWWAARRHDVVYVNGLGAECALGAALAGRPAVHKIVGDYAWERAVGRGWFRGSIQAYQAHSKGLALRLADLVRTVPLRLAHTIIVPSQYLSRIVSDWKIDAAKIRVVPNATDVSVASGELPALPPWRGKTLLTICRLVPWKGVDALIAILPELSETRLVIAGDGHLRDPLAALAESLGVDARVVFLGDVPHRDVPGYLAQSDAFVLNSSYEGLPHVVLEAMAARAPVIATDAGGTSELVEHGITGLLVPIGDGVALKGAIAQLWNQPALGERLAEEAAERCRVHFDFEAMVTKTEAVLRGAVTNTSQRAGAAVEVTS